MTDDQMRAAFEAWLNPGKHAGNVSAWVPPGRYEKDTHQLAWLAWCAARREPPDMRHPKIQALIGSNARKSIELRLVEQLLDEGPDCDLTSMDMEYWHGLHDKLRDRLAAAQQPPT